MAKKFKDTKVGKFLSANGSSIVDTLGSALPDKGLLAIVKNLINKQPMPIKDKEIALRLLDQDIAEMQEVFYTIIEEQIKGKMLAEASPEYAFVAVSPSMVPEEKSQPKRALICISGTLLGGMLSVLLVLVMHYGRKSGI